MDRVITRDATRLQENQVFYTPWCDERGKVIDDGTVTRLDEATFRWTAADPNLGWFRMNAAGLDVDIEDVTDELAALALQGPRSRDVMEAATGRDWKDLRYFRRPTAIAGIEVDVTRTGYTGDLGYELWVAADRAVDLWDALFDAGRAFGLLPVGTRALDVVRVEAGLILIDADYTSVRDAWSAEQEYSPLEIGLGRFVDLRKGGFVGKQALLTEQAAGGPPRRLVGLELIWDDLEAAYAEHGLPPTPSPEVSREAVPVFHDRRPAGRATSMTWSPTLKRMITLASVDRRVESLGPRLQVVVAVEGQHHRVGATVVPLPFLDLPRKRA